MLRRRKMLATQWLAQPREHWLVEFSLSDGTNIPTDPDGNSRGNILKMQAIIHENGIEITSVTSIPL